ncbi:MAG: hypothetical protein RL131_1529 [Bacteroidota bacterium]|jgi:DNA-binding MarR family transcriptional regulator
MGIEKDIQQASFKTEHAKAVVNIIYSYHWLTEKIKSFLQQEDITLQQYNILRILRGSDPKPLSTLDIRERMLDKMSDTSRIVDRLVIKGWVTKKIRETDKRLVDVSITKEGKKLLEKMDKKEAEMNNIVAGLSSDELKSLNALLDKMRGSVD